MDDQVEFERIVNAAAVAAGNCVHEYAMQFDKREEYLPLEKLAHKVQRTTLEAAIKASLMHIASEEAMNGSW